MSRYTFPLAFQVEPYGWYLYFFTEKEKLIRFVRRKEGDNIRRVVKDAGGVAHFGEKNLVYVGVFNGCAGTLSHEATHVANRILHAAGVEVTHDNDEAQAYLVGHIVRECFPHIKEKT